VRQFRSTEQHQGYHWKSHNVENCKKEHRTDAKEEVL
jgi:hypothetical protein